MPNPWDAVLANSQRSVCRQEKDSDAHSALSPGVDVRVIVVAQGIQFNNAWFDLHIDMAENLEITTAIDYLPDLQVLRAQKTPHGLKDTFGDDLIMLDDSSASYWSEAQQVQFYIFVVSTKDLFIKALETPGLHVIYSGHARYGQGPCFGDADDGPGENWGNGIDPATYGIYRMGFPLIGIEIEEVLKQKYSISPVIADGTKPAPSLCHPEIPIGNLHQWSLDELTLDPHDNNKHSFNSADLKALLKPEPAADVKFWGFDAAGHSGYVRHILVYADWQNTGDGYDYDLGATDIQCRVFCHFGCSSFIHNFPIVRERKQWQREGDYKFAYWTQKPSTCPYTTNAWLSSILAYSKPNNSSPWEPSLKWALQHTNDYLKAISSPKWNYACDIIDQKKL